MNPLTFEYKISIWDYHTALYFGMVTRYRNLVRIFIAVSGTALLCYLTALMGLMPYFALPSYIFLGYLVCICFMMARVEHGVLKLVKNPNNPLQHPLRLEFAREQLKVETPHNGERTVHQLSKLFLVFELSNVFLIYLDPINTIILPNRSMRAADRVALRERFGEALHDRFQTRFGANLKAPKMQSLTGRKRFF